MSYYCSFELNYDFHVFKSLHLFLSQHVLAGLKGTVSRDFLYSVFSPKQLLLVPLEMSLGRFDFFPSWLSYKHFKMTPRCPMHLRVETPRGPMYRGVKTPRCPMYRGVAKLDPLKIQKSPKYRRAKTTRCPRYQRVKTLRCPMYRGVKTLQYFVSQNSPVSYVPGSRKT